MQKCYGEFVWPLKPTAIITKIKLLLQKKWDFPLRISSVNCTILIVLYNALSYVCNYDVTMYELFVFVQFMYS